MDQPIISFSHVSKEYTLYKNDQERFRALFIKPRHAKINKALKDVSFEIPKGASVGFIGDNGAGKSTILKMITGVAHPTEGEVQVHGKVAALLELTAGFSTEIRAISSVLPMIISSRSSPRSSNSPSWATISTSRYAPTPAA